MCKIEMLFPKHIRCLFKTREWLEGLEEIRVRIGQPIEFLYETKIGCLMLNQWEAYVCESKRAWQDKGKLYRASSTDVAEMISYISNYSLYAYKEEIRQGYITIEGGHRIGVAGQAAMENGRITGIYHIAFLNIRVAHERFGCADKVLPFIRQKNSIYNTLILSAPGAGKTTLLRDSIRSISAGNKDCEGLKVCVVDERSEIAACYHGIPQNDLGPRTDILDGCNKAEGLQMLIRAMSPQVVAVDELGTEEDFLAVEQAVNCGSRVIGTVHAADMKELAEKNYLKKWMEKAIFKRFVLIEKEKGERKIHVFDEYMELLC